MSDNLFNEVKLKVVQLAEQKGIHVHELLFQIQQEIHMNILRRVLMKSETPPLDRTFLKK